ncbi:MAG: HAD hydrolase-like protein, partial [Rhodospirillaceae bacterium]|nr:HAD hydrolase-like protein [Rhodospirillaceae bacterium]
LMVGDSMEHDIAGAARAGWSTAFIRGGIHGDEFTPSAGDVTILSTLRSLTKLYGGISPDYALPVLK